MTKTPTTCESNTRGAEGKKTWKFKQCGLKTSIYLPTVLLWKTGGLIKVADQNNNFHNPAFMFSAQCAIKTFQAFNRAGVSVQSFFSSYLQLFSQHGGVSAAATTLQVRAACCNLHSSRQLTAFGLECANYII